jgi:hypothetical protein
MSTTTDDTAYTKSEGLHFNIMYSNMEDSFPFKTGLGRHVNYNAQALKQTPLSRGLFMTP